MDAVTDAKAKRLVNLEQLKGLIEFLKEHQDLAKGHTRGRRGKLHTLKLWNTCAKKLNSIKDGAVKDGRAWSKYWCDWKYRVRKRALELKVAKDNNRPPPDGVTPLSNMEESILNVIGGGAIDNIIIKTDPLGVDSEEEALANNEDNVQPKPMKTRGRKRRHSSTELADLDDHGGPSSSPVDQNHGAHTMRKGDSDDEAAAFLKLEREKLDYSKRLCDTVQTLTTEITRLADILGHIRDVLVNNRINL